MEELPNASSLLKPVLLALRNLGGSGTIEQIEKEVIRDLNISNSLASMTRIGSRTELGYRLSWARTKGKNLGYLDRDSFKIWSLTERGKREVSN